MTAMMSDLIEGHVTPSTANATCNAAGKLLKVIEMELKYGADPARIGGKILRLSA